MNLSQFFSPILFGSTLIVIGAIFCTVWFFDHLTHKRIWQEDFTDGELRTHRMILYASWVLLASLALLAINPLLALPLFIGSFITRFTHEFIDEMHWHLPRCDEKETLLHLTMWISINAGTALMFIWGFFFQYEGFLSLPIWMLAIIALEIIVMLYIGHHEIVDYKDKRVQLDNLEEQLEA